MIVPDLIDFIEHRRTDGKSAECADHGLTALLRAVVVDHIHQTQFEGLALGQRHVRCNLEHLMHSRRDDQRVLLLGHRTEDLTEVRRGHTAHQIVLVDGTQQIIAS